MSFAMPSDANVSQTGVFGQVMYLVAATLGVFTLGAYLGRDLAGGLSLICFILSFVCVFGLNYARNSGGGAVGLLAATGLFLGLGLGGGIDAYTSADPGVVWQAGAATALFVAALGSLGYMTRSDLSGGYRVLFFLLLGLIVYGLVSLFVSIPAGNVIYAVLGLGIFGGYTLLDFNRLRGAGSADSVSIASGIFLDVLNVFTFFLQLFGRGRD
ncbi:MAG TPA: Bax inhibitor-1 family protein [Solirubrobacteraceae bacterium]|nr:Bax inhibitor-1 family protein [Solirubrobacteraceae bacterium]